MAKKPTGLGSALGPLSVRERYIKHSANESRAHRTAVRAAPKPAPAPLKDGKRSHAGYKFAYDNKYSAKATPRSKEKWRATHRSYTQVYKGK